MSSVMRLSCGLLLLTAVGNLAVAGSFRLAICRRQVVLGAAGGPPLGPTPLFEDYA